MELYLLKGRPCLEKLRDYRADVSLRNQALSLRTWFRLNERYGDVTPTMDLPRSSAVKGSPVPRWRVFSLKPLTKRIEFAI
jgi:hypothetical protein